MFFQLRLLNWTIWRCDDNNLEEDHHKCLAINRRTSNKPQKIHKYPLRFDTGFHFLLYANQLGYFFFWKKTELDKEKNKIILIVEFLILNLNYGKFIKKSSHMKKRALSLSLSLDSIVWTKNEIIYRKFQIYFKWLHNSCVHFLCEHIKLNNCAIVDFMSYSSGVVFELHDKQAMS